MARLMFRIEFFATNINKLYKSKNSRKMLESINIVGTLVLNQFELMGGFFSIE